MIRVPYEDIIKRIQSNTDMTQTDIDIKVNKKLDQLSGLISKEGAAHIVANELGINIYPKQSGLIKVKDALQGMRDVEVIGKVIRLFEVNNFNVNGREGSVGSFVLGDETGTIRITLWNKQAELLKQLKEGDNVKIKSAYVKDNQGRKEIHLNDQSDLEINPEGLTIGEVKETEMLAGRKKINELTEKDQNVEILATVVQVFEPRYFEEKRTGNPSFVVNAVLDDGTENIRTVFFKNQAINLTNQTEEQMLAFKDDLAAFEPVKHDLLGKIIKVVGRTTNNEMFNRLEFISQMVFANPNTKEEIERLETEEKKMEEEQEQPTEENVEETQNESSESSEETPTENTTEESSEEISEETVEEPAAEESTGEESSEDESGEEESAEESSEEEPSAEKLVEEATGEEESAEEPAAEESTGEESSEDESGEEESAEEPAAEESTEEESSEDIESVEEFKKEETA